VAQVNESILEEFRAELEARGVPARQAGEIVRSRSLIDTGDVSSARPEPAQHVVPVSRGWLVIRSLPPVDAALFFNRSAAEAWAYDLGKSAGSAVVVHDSNGMVEREVYFPPLR
jgi:hypothetical protein